MFSRSKRGVSRVFETKGQKGRGAWKINICSWNFLEYGCPLCPLNLLLKNAEKRIFEPVFQCFRAFFKVVIWRKSGVVAKNKFYSSSSTSSISISGMSSFVFLIISSNLSFGIRKYLIPLLLILSNPLCISMSINVVAL